VASCKVKSCKVASCKVASCKVASCTGIVVAVFMTPHARFRIRSRIQKGAQGALFDEIKPKLS
jgi:hypothetical protein